MTHIVALSGSLKSTSLNQKLVAVAAEGARQGGVTVSVIQLADFDIPLFSEELEAKGTPASVMELKKIFASAQGILIANPEYNGSLSGVLKNAIDWLSRPSQDEQIGSAFQDKVAGIMATSPGGLGGLRGLNHLKDVLYNLGTLVLPNPIAVPFGGQAFDQADQIQDEATAEQVKALGAKVASISRQLYRVEH